MGKIFSEQIEFRGTVNQINELFEKWRSDPDNYLKTEIVTVNLRCDDVTGHWLVISYLHNVPVKPSKWKNKGIKKYTQAELEEIKNGTYKS